MSSGPKATPSSISQNDWPTDIREEDLSLFSAPWCQALLNNPSVINKPAPNRRPPPPLYSHCSNSMFSQTLWTATTIRAYHAFYMPLPENTDFAYELNMMYALGTGLDGMTGRAHGGLVSLILDQCLGVCATNAHWADATAKLEVEFLRPVDTPGIVLCKSSVDRIEGNRVWMVGTLDDGMGKVYARGKGLFVRSRKTRSKFGLGEGKGGLHEGRDQGPKL